MMSSHNFRVRTILAVSGGLLAVPAAQADLNQVPGMTPIQAPVAATIQAICPPLNSPDLSQSLTPAQRTLAQSCTKMVQTSNAQQGQPATSQNLGLTESGLRDAIQGISPEEMNAQNRGRTINNNSPINARLLALRRGAGGGPVAANFEFNGQQLSIADVFAPESRGGGASADDGLGGPWSGFINGHYSWGKRDAFALESGFDFDDYGIMAGADYRLSDATVAGVALNYAKSKADFANSGGDVESSNYGISGYASHSMGESYVEGFVGYSRVDFDTARRILVVSTTAVEGFDTTARGSTDASQFTASIGGGRDFVSGDTTITPFARLSYLHLSVDGFTEREDKHSLGLDVRSRSVTSVQSALGAQFTKAISTQSGVVTPYAGLEWNHEFRNNSDEIVAKYTHDPFNTFFAIPTASPDRNYFTLRAGLTGVFANGLAAFANVDHVMGLEHTRSSSITVGVRKEF